MHWMHSPVTNNVQPIGFYCKNINSPKCFSAHDHIATDSLRLIFVIWRKFFVALPNTMQKNNLSLFQLIFFSRKANCLYLEDLVSTAHRSDFVVGVGPSQFTQMTHWASADFTVHVHFLHLMLWTHEHLRNSTYHTIIVWGSRPGHKCCSQLHTIELHHPFKQGVKIRPEECMKQSAGEQITACKVKATQIKNELKGNRKIWTLSSRKFWIIIKKS